MPGLVVGGFAHNAVGEGEVGSGASLYDQALAGGITPSGALVAQKVTSVSLSGGITPSGALVNVVNKILSGATTPSGALVRLVNKILAGTFLEAATNLALYSEELDNAAWAAQANNVTVTADQADGNDGTHTADKLAFGAGDNAYRYQTVSSASAIAGRTFTFSVWLWAPTKATIVLRITNSADGSDDTRQVINLTTGITRYSATRTFTGAGSNIDIGLDDRTIVGGDGVADFIYAWGGQLEEASSPGRYVKTTNAPVEEAAGIAGVLVRHKIFFSTLSGGITPSGALARIANKLLVGGSTPAGSLSRLTQVSLVGGSTPAGSLAKQANKNLAGEATPSGAISKQANKGLAGDVTPGGELDETVNSSLAGAITPAGTISKQTNKPLVGEATPSGALSRITSLLLTGGATPDGALIKLVNKLLGGGDTPSGDLLATGSRLVTVSGDVTPSGTLTRLTDKVLAGGDTPAGSLVKRANISLSGLVASAGEILRAHLRNLTGSITPGGDVETVLAKDLSGILAPSGTLSRLTKKFVGGSVTPVGTLVRRVTRTLAGLLVPIGRLYKITRKSFGGFITPHGTVTTDQPLPVDLLPNAEMWVTARDNAAEPANFPGPAWQGFDRLRFLGPSTGLLPNDYPGQLYPNLQVAPLFCRALALDAAMFLAVKKEEYEMAAKLRDEYNEVVAELLRQVRAQAQIADRRFPEILGDA